MRTIFGVALCLGAIAMGQYLQAAEAETATTPLDVTMETLDGKEVNLAQKYQGKVVLLVNVASKCGLTPQYEPLQALHEKYGKEGLAIVGVPCNQFGGQEPGTAKEISDFCRANYGVKFDMLAKVDVNGDSA
jgi:glutathione peroxidase